MDQYFCCSCVTMSMALSACNSAGHLSNHTEVAPNFAGTTFAISNTLVSTTTKAMVIQLQQCVVTNRSLLCHTGHYTWHPVWSVHCRARHAVRWSLVSCLCHRRGHELCGRSRVYKPQLGHAHTVVRQCPISPL